MAAVTAVALLWHRPTNATEAPLPAGTIPWHCASADRIAATYPCTIGPIRLQIPAGWLVSERPPLTDWAFGLQFTDPSNREALLVNVRPSSSDLELKDVAAGLQASLAVGGGKIRPVTSKRVEIGGVPAYRLERVTPSDPHDEQSPLRRLVACVAKVGDDIVGINHWALVSDDDEASPRFEAVLASVQVASQAAPDIR